MSLEEGQPDAVATEALTCDLLELDTIVSLSRRDEYFWNLEIDGRSLKVAISGVQSHHIEALALMFAVAHADSPVRAEAS